MPYTKEHTDTSKPGESRPVQHFEVTEEEAGQRLDNYLQRRLGGLPRSRLYRVIRKGEVRVNGHRVRPERRLQPHDRVRVPPVRLASPDEPRHPPRELAARALQVFRTLGIGLFRDGRLIESTEECLVLLTGQSQYFLDRQLPALRALQIS